MDRTKQYNENLNKRLKNKKYASSYLQNLMEGEDGLSPGDALQLMIQQMDVKEFCALTGISLIDVTDFLEGRYSSLHDTLNKFLKPFNLRVSIQLEAI